MQRLFTRFSQYTGFAYDLATGLKNNSNRLAAQCWKGGRICAVKCGSATHRSQSADVGRFWAVATLLSTWLILTDHPLIGVPVIRFKKFNGFWSYINKRCRSPLQEAKEEGSIKVLLRKL
ncbi:hypothetical protein GQ44DRAFT_732659 [Phaeosphaeriaceae sp. PMI808]|nr:hypothetical protein GQ44DRAFT_732659 [Phaeosphaeriaceae sp. PMI808]